MTEKNWFIFKGDHHLGPFTFTEILNKVKLAELKNEELLWREGDADWKPVLNQDDIISALRKEKEESTEARRELEERTRESQRKEFAAKLERERAIEGQQDSEKVKAIAQEKQRQRQLILEQEIARKEAAALEAEQRRIRVDNQAKQDALLQRASEKKKAKEEEVEFEAGPPPLPPLPGVEDELEEEEAVDSFLNKEVLHSSQEWQEGPDEEVLTEETAVDFESEQVENEEFVSVENEEIKGRSFYGSIILIVAVVVLLLFSFNFLFQNERSLAGLSNRDKDSLRNIISKPFSSEALHKLRPTTNLNSLWLGSNFPDEAAVYLRMESIKGRILGEGKVTIQASSTFKGHAALFRKFEVIEGVGLVPGEYLYEIKGFQTGLMKNLRQALGTMPVLRELKAFRPERSQFSFKGTILIAATSMKKFNALLAKKKSRIEKNVLRPLRDRRQRLKTFLNLLNQVESIYNNILGRITKGRSMHLFEKRYNKEVGPYLRDLIIDTNKVHISIINLDPVESKAYEDVMNFGKDVGHIASEMVTKTRKVKRLGRAKTEVMKERFRLLVDELRQRGKVELRKMNGTINQLEESEKK